MIVIAQFVQRCRSFAYISDGYIEIVRKELLQPLRFVSALQHKYIVHNVDIYIRIIDIVLRKSVAYPFRLETQFVQPGGFKGIGKIQAVCAGRQFGILRNYFFAVIVNFYQRIRADHTLHGKTELRIHARFNHFFRQRNGGNLHFFPVQRFGKIRKIYTDASKRQ